MGLLEICEKIHPSLEAEVDTNMQNGFWKYDKANNKLLVKYGWQKAKPMNLLSVIFSKYKDAYKKKRINLIQTEDNKEKDTVSNFDEDPAGR